MRIAISKKNDDHEGLRALLAGLDYYDDVGDALEGFWTASEEGHVVGAAQLLRCGGVRYLGYVGVAPERRGRGVARALLKGMLGGVQEPVYCYTVIPDFFRRFGFEVGEPHPAIPTREENDCEGCDPARCTCMVWRPA